MPNSKHQPMQGDWVSSVSRIYENGVVYPPLDLGPANGKNASDVDLDQLCEAILANLKLPRE